MRPVQSKVSPNGARLSASAVSAVQNAGERSFADDLAGDALPQVALAGAVGEQRDARLPLHVDEAGGHDAARGVDHVAGGGRRQVADGRDAIAGNADIGTARGRVEPVDDLATADDDVEFGSARLAGRRHEEDGRERRLAQDRSM